MDPRQIFQIYLWVKGTQYMTEVQFKWCISDYNNALFLKFHIQFLHNYIVTAEWKLWYKKYI